MKELQLPVKEEVVITGQKEQEKKLQFIGSLKPHKGQKCWELDLATGIIRPAEIKSITAELTGAVHRQIIIKPKHLYCVALNLENADRKFVKMLIGK